MTVDAVKKALEMMNSEAGSSVLPDFLQSPMMVHDMLYSELSSPALPGFGPSPMVRQLRITDSPFPLRDVTQWLYVENLTLACVRYIITS
ncbi:hypothetical protein HYC85_004292 [Camellia sinensis]|uniref:Uncharacterized protein n=1 Tax=Camellia sinensis TaxID=4442 RepID=A0A7J7HXE3_CAMSI|nr:hypothetical protein HYC85_004292 [Camellia sinensis]